MARRFVASSSQALYNNSISSGLASASKAALNVWLKRTSSGSRISAGSFLNSQNTFYALLGADGNLYIGFAAGDLTEYAYYALSGTSIHNIGVDFDGTQSGNSNRLKCYVDGSLISLTYNATVGANLSPNLVDWQIGRRGTGEYHDGDVALCGLWGGVTLGATAHAALAAGSTDPTDYTTSQIGAWLLAETGSTDNAADSSGNGNTLTQTGSPIWVADPSFGGGGIEGTLTATLGNATLSATGVLPIVGTASPTLAAATLSATGTLAITGTTTATLADATLSATGALSSPGTGTLTATLADATLSAAGTLAITGTASPTLADATLASTGALAIKGTLSQTLENATLAAYSAAPNTGTLSVTLADATLVATGGAASEVRGRLVRRRRGRYLVGTRVYDALTPEQVSEAARAAAVPLEQVREVVKMPATKEGKAPRMADAAGFGYWPTSQFWGPRGIAAGLATMTAPLPPEFFDAAPAGATLARRQQQEQEALMLLMAA